jgi:hypothetical protein
MVDRYTKSVLTVIAVTLVIIAAQNAFTPATAQIWGCGETAKEVCWVDSPRPLEIVPATPDGMFWVTGSGGAPVDVRVKQ